MWHRDFQVAWYDKQPTFGRWQLPAQLGDKKLSDPMQCRHASAT